MKRLVIIDGECNEAIYRQLTGKKPECFQVLDDRWQIYHPQVTSITHATVCGSILSEAADSEVTFLSVVGQDGRLSPECQASALKWCHEEKVEGISISVGTSNWFDMQRFLPEIETLKKMSITLVAAASNDGVLSYPASLPGCVGVRYNKDIWGIRRREKAWDGICLDVGFPEPEVVQRLRREYDFRIEMANSMAAPWLLSQYLKSPECIRYAEKWNQLESLMDSAEESILQEELELPVIAVWGEAGKVDALLEALRCKGYLAFLAGVRRKNDIKKGHFCLEEGRIQECFCRYIRKVKMGILLLEHEYSECENLDCLKGYVDRNVYLDKQKDMNQLVSKIEQFYQG